MDAIDNKEVFCATLTLALLQLQLDELHCFVRLPEGLHVYMETPPLETWIKINKFHDSPWLL